MPESDPWDWPLLLYVGTVILKRTEGEFWRMTPRKLRALFDAHITVNGDKSDASAPEAPTGFIDQIM